MDLIGPLVSLAIGLLLVAACGGFVAAEFSLITVNRNDVEAAAESGDKRAGGVLQGMKTLSTQLSGAQLGITVTNLGIGFLAEPAIAALVGPPLVDAGLSEVAARSASVALALVLATGTTMIFGELVPKNMAIAQPLRTAKLVVGFQRLFTKAFGLPIRLFNGNANAVVRALGVEPQEELGSARSADELAVLVKRSADEGALAEETASLVQRTLAFGDRRAHDAMVPRGRMDSLEVDQSVADLLELARETGHSRFPVLDDENEIAGVAHIRHGLAIPFAERPTTRVDAVMGTATFVPDTVPLDDLMDTLRAGGLQMAVVVDEFGDHAGLITLEDLVEEIVGEVRDEHDEEMDDTPEPDGSWDLDARMRPDEAAERLGVTVPEHEDYDTLGGLVTMELGRLAEVGDEIVVDTDPAPGEQPARLRIEVTEIDGMRIETVHVKVEPAPGDEDAQGEDEEEQR
ncbi:hemolysin family protein [Brachybacterium saurashtrense]|uniref:HlyC/CorC family transporter n=1 Tax=Brachybacterium saurashtrense TaxID=556288 RepID=A0A345YRL9_9MICO|nr:hemolysin family protein [Brachybacterium saurashtrense]AXK46571.1 HlyC/CorC family transporter [Brachybacterium saurashtrense]RRR24312.1 HlyC/CorC family transporter [Brachybacterium saurashtrense]